RPPHVAPHCLGSVVASPHVERKAVGDLPDEVWMQQRRERFAVTGSKCSVELLGSRHVGVEGVINSHDARSPLRCGWWCHRSRYHQFLFLVKFLIGSGLVELSCCTRRNFCTLPVGVVGRSSAREK